MQRFIVVGAEVAEDAEVEGWRGGDVQVQVVVMLVLALVLKQRWQRWHISSGCIGGGRGGRGGKVGRGAGAVVQWCRRCKCIVA